MSARHADDRRRLARSVILAALAVVVLLGGGMVILARANIAPPNIDSPPGVFGSLRLEISPVPADVRVDDDPPRHADHLLALPGLDPNRPHRVRVSAAGYQSVDQNVVVPANGSRSIHIDLRPSATAP